MSERLGRIKATQVSSYYVTQSELELAQALHSFLYSVLINNLLINKVLIFVVLNFTMVNFPPSDLWSRS